MVSAVIISIGGRETIVSQVTINKKASDMVTTAQITIPYNQLQYVQNNAEVGIEYNGRVLFHGLTADWSLVIQGGKQSMSIPCTDLSFKLYRMVVSTSVTTYPIGTDIGAIIYATLENTGIDRSHINQTTGILLTEVYEIKPATMKAEVISYICSKYKFLFYLSYSNPGGVYTTYGEFDTYATMETSTEFVEEHAITLTNIIVFSVGIKSVPELICTRVICTRENEDNTFELGTATTGSAPYIDKVVVINPANTDDIDDLAAAYLASYATGDSQLEASFRDLSIGLFNILDISGLSTITGTSVPLTQYRVTDLIYEISEVGVVSTVQAIDPDAGIWDSIISVASSSSTSESNVAKETTKIVNSAKARIGTVTTTDATTITTQYTSGELEIISNRGVV